MSKGRESTNGPIEGGTPRAAVERLSLYLRQLEALHRNGQETVSSNQLGTALEITDAQVRKDLTYFGQFGYPGIGYRVAELRDSLRAVLGTNRTWNLGLIGVGNLGRALLGYRGFPERGFVISALFDRDPKIIGQTVHDLAVLPLERLPEVTQQLQLELAVLAVPAEAVDEVTAMVLAAGITGVLNFVPVQLKVPVEISVVSVDLGLHLEQLAFQVNKRRSPAEDAGGD